MFSSLQRVAHNTAHAFLDGPGCLPSSSPPHSCLQLFSASPGEEGRGCPSRICPAFFGSAGPGLLKDPECGATALPPPHPSLFTPPHSWQCPAQRWTGARRGRAEGETRRVPASGPAWELLKAGRQS